MLKLKDLSYWERNTYFDNLDFLIIGSGIVGCSTALHLRKTHPQARILVLERSYLPSGASTKNAGFACFGSVTELVDDLGRMPASEVWDTVSRRWEGLQYLRELIGDAQLDFQSNGSWDLVHNLDATAAEKGLQQLPELNQMLERITGMPNVMREDRNAAQHFGFREIETSFYNRLEGQIDSGKMMARFHALLVASGIHLLNGIEVLNFEAQADEVVVQLSIGEIRVPHLAICVNGFAARFLPQEDVLPARAQVLITQPIPDLKWQGTFHLDAGYYYFRNIHNRVLLGGGRNLDIPGETTTELRNTTQITDALQRMLREVVLPDTPFEIDRQWAGIMGVGQTKKPIVKLIHPRVATGVRMGGMGIAIGSLVGKEVAELF